MAAAPDPPTFRNWTTPPLDGVVAVSETLANADIRIGDPLMGAKGPAGATTFPAARRSGELINCGQGAAKGGGDVPQLLPDVDRRRPGIPGGVPTQNWTFSQFISIEHAKLISALKHKFKEINTDGGESELISPETPVLELLLSLVGDETF